MIGVTYYRESKFGDGNLQQLLWIVGCNSSDNTLLSCSNTYTSYCYYGRTFGVKCFS